MLWLTKQYLVLAHQVAEDDCMSLVSARFRVDFLLLFVAAAWGSTYLAAKELASTDTVVALLAVRMFCAAVLMVAVLVVRRKRVTAAELSAGVSIGLLLSAVFALETFGIAHTSATNAGLIISLTLVFTPLLESVVARRMLPGRFFSAALMSVAGVVLLAGDGSFSSPGVGDVLMLAAAVVRALHVVTMHRVSRGKTLDSLSLTTVQLGMCAAVFAASSLVFGEPIVAYLTCLSVWQAVLCLYLVLVCTVFAFFVQLWAIRRTSPSRVSLLLGTEPVWAAVVGIGIAHDAVAAVGYAGIILVLAGTAWGRSLTHTKLQSTPTEAPRPLVDRRP